MLNISKKKYPKALESSHDARTTQLTRFIRNIKIGVFTRLRESIGALAGAVFGGQGAQSFEQWWIMPYELKPVHLVPAPRASRTGRWALLRMILISFPSFQNIWDSWTNYHSGFGTGHESILRWSQPHDHSKMARSKPQLARIRHGIMKRLVFAVARWRRIR